MVRVMFGNFAKIGRAPFHLVLLLKQNLVLLFIFSSSSSTAISFHICV
jgi:hypothetical protein